MSWTCTEENKQSIARKRHSCAVCDSCIQKGEPQITRAGVCRNDGWLRMHMHIECEEYSRDWDDMEWECHSGGISRAEIVEALKPRLKL